MLKRYLIRVFIFSFVALTTGCVSSGPIALEGRATSINDLATRLSFRYNGGLNNVRHNKPKSKWHGEYGSFAMTLFSVKASVGDIPDMVSTFRDYCSFRGGIQNEVGLLAESPKSFSIACEPRQPRFGTDPAYFLFFVNVLLSPSAKKSIPKARNESYAGKFEGGGYETGYSSGYATNYRDAYHDAYRNAYRNAYRDAYGSAYISRGKRARRKNNINAFADGYCVNFLGSENLTYNTAFSDMPNYKEYRKRFEAVLKKNKAHC